MAGNHRKALDLAQQGDWEAAHKIIQVSMDASSCQIHGYLHRVEGDLGNASYWYRQGGMALPDNSLEEEFRRLSAAVDADNAAD